MKEKEEDREEARNINSVHILGERCMEVEVDEIRGEIKRNEAMSEELR